MVTLRQFDGDNMTVRWTVTIVLSRCHHRPVVVSQRTVMLRVSILRENAMALTAHRNNLMSDRKHVSPILLCDPGFTQRCMINCYTDRAHCYRDKTLNLSSLKIT